MDRPDMSLSLIFLYILIISSTIGESSGQDGLNNSDKLNQLILNIYVDEAGRALINGYADNPGPLAFLDHSEYSYENDTCQLYAITGALTSKSRDNWTVSFESKGRYDEYQLLLYLPPNAKLRDADCSPGLDYLVSTANESVTVEVHGSDIENPAVDVQYVLTLVDAANSEANAAEDIGIEYQYKTIVLLIFLAAGLCLLIILLRSQSTSLKPAGGFEPHNHRADIAESNPDPQNLPAQDKAQAEKSIDAGPSIKPINEDFKGDLEDRSKMRDRSEALMINALMTNQRRDLDVQLTSEISAVMDTLTDKERSIVKVLLERRGAMTQTEIRYELDISKSSLSGILTALEKRKIITKKEKGRTNVIELSEQLLNHQERS